MIDLAWSEIALIAVVALVVIGPKDLPEAVRGVARGVQKLRRMAGEFRAQADELVREANLDELRQQIHDIRSFNVRDEFEKAVDKDGSLRRSFDDPLRDTYTPQTPAYTPSAVAMEGACAQVGTAEPAAAPGNAAPAFIPPTDAASAAASEPPAPPPFVPPAEASAGPQPVDSPTQADNAARAEPGRDAAAHAAPVVHRT
jgi:sec-independent protein translocase protein TatB